MNRRNPHEESAGPKFAQGHSTKCQSCAGGTAEDRELVDLIQQSLKDSLAYQTPSPEVWSKIYTQLSDRKQPRWGERALGLWPRLVSNTVAVGLLIALAGLIMWQPLRPAKREVAALPSAPTKDSQTGWRGLDERGAEIPQERERTSVSGTLPSGTSAFDSMTKEGLLNLGYLNYLNRPPNLTKEVQVSRSGHTQANNLKNPIP